MLVAPLFRVSSALADGAKRLMEHNWAGNLRYSAARLLKPKTAAEVQELVLLGAKPKALGSRHSFSTIADTTGDLISLENLRGIQINPRALTVTVGAGIRYGDLVDTLQKNRLALRNLASLPHISVAGAIATGTHGSGDENGNLSTHVLALELVTADGKVLKLSRDKDPERFYGAVVNLGALGIVTSVTLEVIPTFDVQQVVYEFLPLKALYADFDAVMGSAYSVSLFIDWQSETVNQVWQKHFRLSEGDFVAPAEWLGAKRAAKDLHPIVTMDAKPCTPQMGVAGPWFSRLPHFKMEFTPSSG
jgi:xylitol oxidase